MSPLPSIRIRPQGEPSPGRVDDPCYPYWDFEAEDAAAILAGTRVAYVAEIVSAAGTVLADCWNLVAGPGQGGVYRHPRRIPDRSMAFYITDLWTAHCGIAPGDLVRHFGRHHTVVAFEETEAEHGARGYLTGWVTCQALNGSGHRPVWAGNLRKIKELMP